jgi:hypothetical protein
MSKYGQSLDGGESMIEDLSNAVWESQSGGS